MAAAPRTAPTHREAPATTATAAVDRAVYAVARHWLALTNALLLCYVALATAPPLLLERGLDGWARPIYALYRPFCHGRDDRSFHLLGERMACCQRCTAIHAGLFVCGLAYVGLRHRYRLRRLSWRGFALFVVPLALDGVTQAIGMRESTWWLRVMTGGVFAVGIAWMLLPPLEAGFAELRRQVRTRLNVAAAEDREVPLVGAPPTVDA